MKKNLMSVLILAILVVNTAITALLLITVMPQASKTNELIGKIAGAIELEMSSGQIVSQSTIPIEFIESYALAGGDTMTINLKPEPGSSDMHVAMLSVTLSLNTEDGEYEDKKPLLEANEGLARDVVNKVVASHTLDELREDQQGIQKEILGQLQGQFSSDFIVGVTFPTISYQ